MPGKIKPPTVAIPPRKSGYAHLPVEKLKRLLTPTKTEAAKSLHPIARGEVLPSEGKHTAPKPAFIKEPSQEDAKPLTINTTAGIKTINPAQLEAAIADFYRYLLGPHRVPKTRAFRSATGETHIVVSREIPEFIPFATLAYKTEDEPQTLCKVFLEGEVGSLAAANFLLEESDCHWNNFGFNKDGKLVRIDFDLSLASITRRKISSSYKTTDYTTITERDLDSLLNSQDFRPHHSMFRMARGTPKEHNFLDTPFGSMLLDAERGNTQFKIDKWKTLIKAALLSKTMIKNMFSAHIEDQDVVEALTDHLYNRFQTIKGTMLKMDSFQVFFRDHHQEIIKEIEKDIDEYNKLFEKKYFERQVVTENGDIETEFAPTVSKLQKDLLLKNLDYLIKTYHLVPTNTESILALSLRVRSAKSPKHRGFSAHEFYFIDECEQLINFSKSKEDLHTLATGLTEKIASLKQYLDTLSLHFEQQKTTLNQLEEEAETLDTDSAHRTPQLQANLQARKTISTTMHLIEKEFHRVNIFGSYLQKLAEKALAKRDAIKEELPDPEIQKRIDSLLKKLDLYLENKYSGASGTLEAFRQKISSSYKKQSEERTRLALHLKHMMLSSPKTHEAFDKRITSVAKGAEGDKQLTEILKEAVKSPRSK